MNLFNSNRAIINLRFSHLKFTSRWSSWSSKDVRSTFINYFVNEGHEFVPSSSVIPKKKEGTYFINSGMNQFKPIFLGECSPTDKFYQLRRAVNSQKCIRVGGKHNDLEDVGCDLTHHTFFEMLGNWSFGDYFKARACQMAYQLLTKEFKVPSERLYFTYFGGDSHLNLPVDEECKQIWLSLGVPCDRILPFGLKDNFWEMGLTGPCGPCTEIHYDHRGTACDASKVNSGSPDVVEIWNLVFMQYNRLVDNSLVTLPTSHVDTGMGLERMVAVLNGTADNYGTDLFLPLFQEIHKLSGCPMYRGSMDALDTSYRILADHTRMFTVAISDGLLPSQENLGHKLRSLLLRCVDLCRKAFHTDPLTTLPVLVSTVRKSLGSVYPELERNENKVCDLVKAAIHHFDKHKDKAMKSFSKALSRLGDVKVLPGEVILSLEQGQYGGAMSLETITELAASQGIRLDMDGYGKLNRNKKDDVSTIPLTEGPDRASALVNQMKALGVKPTDDTFKYYDCSLGDGVYDFTRMLDAIGPVRVQGLCKEASVVDQLLKADVGEVILDKTCFYGESGGQESDKGELFSESGTFQVTDVQIKSGYVVHYGFVSAGELRVDQLVEPRICQEVREGCMRNHTATHLLHTALTSVLPTTQQQGSSVTWHKLTFDFLALSPLDSLNLQEIENTVRNSIKREHSISRRIIPLDEAFKISNLKALQNETYPPEVSVISVGPVDGSLSSSVELCGGTHVLNTSHLEDFCITQLSSKAQNVKRMTCVTGSLAKLAQLNGLVVKSVGQLLESSLKNLSGQLSENTAHSERFLQQMLNAVDAHQERIEHSLHCLKENQSDYYLSLLDLKDEAIKVQGLLQTYRGILKHILEPDADQLKRLITLLYKFQEIELLPKSAREEAKGCVLKNEMRVTGLVTKKRLELINQMIEQKMNKFPNSPVVSLTMSDVSINHRQVIKSLSQKLWTRGLILLNRSNKNADLFISLPLSTFQLVAKEDIEALLNQEEATARGKLAAQNDDVVIYYFNLQGEIREGDILETCTRKIKQKL